MKTSVRITALAFSLLAAGRLRAGEITVFAAASLTEALKEIAVSHEQTSGDKVRFNFAAASTLAQQIQAGAPADIFFSADEAKMNHLEKLQLIAKETRKPLLGNALVIITAPDGPAINKVADLLQPTVKRISLGDPKAVPVGVYTKRYLEKLGFWLAIEPKIARAENVRASLAVVEMGNAEAGIVYKTDAAITRKVKVVLEIPAAEGPKIVYPVAMVKDSRHADAAKKFLVFLDGREATAIFRRFGFIVLD